jgi:hypothetical protein
VVEGSGFENRRTGNGSVSSNLTSSAEIIEEAAVRVRRGGRTVTKCVTKSGGFGRAQRLTADRRCSASIVPRRALVSRRRPNARELCRGRGGSKG